MNNPIIQRELIGQLRSVKGLGVQIVLVALLTVLVLLRWPAEGRVATTGEQAMNVLRLFGYGMMIAMMLMVPAFPATTLVREKRGGTLALLLNSSLGRWAILLGKLLGSVGFVGTLLILSLPAAAACYGMGGVGMGQLLAIYAILIFMVLQYATLGLLISSYASSADAAMRMTYGAVLVLAVVTLGPDQLFRGVLPGIGLIRSISPIPAMMEALGHAAAGAKGIGSAEGEPVRFVIIALISSIGFAVWTGRRLDYRMFDQARPQGQITDERSRLVRIFRRIMYLWFFDPQRRSGMIGPLTNPVMIKEFRTRKFGRSHWTMRLFALCLIVSFGLTLITVSGTVRWGVAELGRIVAAMQFALIILLTPSLAGGMIASERESGGWTILRTTPLSTRRIVTGKLTSALVSLLMMLVATAPCYWVMIKIATETEWLWKSGVSLALAAAMALLLSAAISSLFRSTAAATATAYAALIGLCAGTMLFWVGCGAPFTHDTVEAALKLNPLAATLHAVGAKGFVNYQLLPINWWITGGICAVSLVVLTVQTWRLTRPT